MSLSRKIADALDALPDAGGSPTVVSVEDGRCRLTLRLGASTPVGLAFDALDFAVEPAADWPPDALHAWGQRLSARVTYLMEPLVILEHDKVGGAVELRSQSPTARDRERAYYEVRLQGQGSLHLSRVAFDDATRRRHAATCQLTREALERLVDDLVACLP